MRPHGWIALLLAAACLAVFLPVGNHQFVGFDDYMYVVQNPNLRDGLSLIGLENAFRPYFSNWIPLTALSFQLDYAAYGLEPAGYHWTNVGLHTLAAVLLFLALARMTGGVWRSAFAAALFAIHPLHVESVAWVSERKDVLSGVFWMLCMLAYARYTERPNIRGYGLVLLCLILGLLAKPTLVTLPFVFLLLDFWPLQRLGRDGRFALPLIRRALFEKLPMFALVVVASAITFGVQRASGSVSNLSQLPLSLRLGNALESYVLYAWKTLWPSGLAAFYPHPFEFDPWRVGGSALLLGVATALALRAASARPYVAMGWFWFLGTLIPVIGLVQVGMQSHADRYTYLPQIGLLVLISWGVVDLAERWRLGRTAIAWAACLVLVAIGAAARSQVKTWSDTETLYRRALAVTRGNYLAHDALGSELLEQQHPDEAERHFAEAARLAPGWISPQLGLADVALARGRVEDALRAYGELLRQAPGNIEAVGRYGLALGLIGRHAEARVQLRRALEKQGGTAELHRAMAEIEAALGNPSAAVRHGREALRLVPDYVEAANNLAWTLATCSDATIRDAEAAIRTIEGPASRSGDPWLLDTLAAAYAAAGRFDVAVASASRAAETATDAAAIREIRLRLALYHQGQAFVDPNCQ